MHSMSVFCLVLSYSTYNYRPGSFVGWLSCDITWSPSQPLFLGLYYLKLCMSVVQCEYVSMWVWVSVWVSEWVSVWVCGREGSSSWWLIVQSGLLCLSVLSAGPKGRRRAIWSWIKHSSLAPRYNNISLSHYWQKLDTSPGTCNWLWQTMTSFSLLTEVAFDSFSLPRAWVTRMGF